MKNRSSEEDDKKIDNGLKKKELEEKYGAKFFEKSELPPDLESAWLNNIETFEEQFSNAKTINVYDSIGKPSYNKLEDLRKEDVSKELERILEIMNHKGVSLETLCEVAEEELYRFITEELFNEEMDDINIPGMMSCFTYEDFHPNAKWDIEHALDYFFRFTFGKHENIGGDGYDILYIDSENFISQKGEAIPEHKVVKTINNFLKSFDSFEIVRKEMESLEINEEKTDAKAHLDIEYKAIYNIGKEWMDYKGEAIFKLHPSEYGGWGIYAMDFPGLKL